MKRITTIFTRMAVLAMICFAVTACDSNDGPLEKAGQSIDKAATDMGNKIEDACEDIKKEANADDTNC